MEERIPCICLLMKDEMPNLRDPYFDSLFRSFQVIILDTGSEDGSVEYVERRWKNLIDSQQLQVHHLDKKEEINFGEARNLLDDIAKEKGVTSVLHHDLDERFDVAFLKRFKQGFSSSIPVLVRARKGNDKHVGAYPVVINIKSDLPVIMRFSRINLPNGKDYPDYQVRLYDLSLREEVGLTWFGKVHETLHVIQGDYMANLDDHYKQILEQEAVPPFQYVTLDSHPILHKSRREDLQREWW